VEIEEVKTTLVWMAAAIRSRKESTRKKGSRTERREQKKGRQPAPAAESSIGGKT
jgi:hypothetical protein